MKPVKNTETPPFVAVPVRAFAECKDPFELSVVAALQFWFWWKGDDQNGLGPEGVAAMCLMSESKAKQVLNDLEKRGWIAKGNGRRDLGQKTRYRLTLLPMDFKAAYAILGVRLPQSYKVQGELALTAPDAPPPSSHQEALTGAPQSRTNIKGIDLRPSEVNRTAGAVKHPQQDELWNGMKDVWAKKFPGEVLQWPDPKNPVTAIQKFQQKLGALIDTFTVEGTLARWSNLVNDGFNRPSLRVFLADAEKFTQARNQGRGNYNAVSHTRDFEG